MNALAIRLRLAGNDANWHIEHLINHPEKPDELMTSAEKEDYFL